MPPALADVLRRVRALAADQKVRFTLKAVRELAALGLLRRGCVVVSFHENEGGDDEEHE